MKLRQFAFLLLALSASFSFSACTSVESKSAEEVIINRSSGGSSDEVVITNADIKSENKPVSSIKQDGQFDKRLLSDKSEIETLIDGFGNRIETRYFAGHPRIRMLILRTSVQGRQEVTVYGQGSDTKLVAGLADRALTASGDEIADAAQLYETPSNGAAKNFMKRNNSETQTPLQPLPSSAFQKPVQYPQPVAPAQAEVADNESPQSRQSNPEEED